MKVHFALCALGKDRPGILSDLSKVILDSGGVVLDSRMTVLGGEFSAILMISGNWSAIAKLEDALPDLQAKLGLAIIAKRTEPRAALTDLLPYVAEIATVEQPGIVYRVAEFFSSRNIPVADLYTSCYTMPYSSTPLFSLSLTVNIPTAIHISSLREQFMDFCDELNLDGVLEPLKR
ncbi:MAG: ACT domain-containing protein [Pseudomonadota bacterium]